MADMSKLGPLIDPEEVIAEIALAPGVPAWYDSSNGFYLTISNPKVLLKRKHKTTLILRAMRHNLLRVVWGFVPDSLADSRNVPAPPNKLEPMKASDKIVKDVKVEPKKETKASNMDSKEVDKTSEKVEEPKEVKEETKTKTTKKKPSKKTSKKEEVKEETK